MRYLLIILIFCSFGSYARLSPSDSLHIDSLQNVIANAAHDTIKINAWVEWDYMIYRDDPKLDFDLSVLIEEVCNENLAKKLSTQERQYYLKRKSFALNNQANYYTDTGEIDKGLQLYIDCIPLRKEANDLVGLSSTYNNIGNVYFDRGDYFNGVDYYTKALRTGEKAESLRSIGSALNNLGLIYKTQGEYDKAIENYERAAEIADEIGYRGGTASCNINIGAIFISKGEYDKAEEHYQISYDIYKEEDHTFGKSMSLNNLGELSLKRGGEAETSGSKQEAIEFYKQALERFDSSLYFKTQIDDVPGSIFVLSNLSITHLKLGNSSESIRRGREALELGLQMDRKPEIKAAAFNLYKAYKKVNKPTQALEMYELYVSTRDTLESEESQREILRQQFSYEYDKKSVEDSLKYALEQERDQMIIDKQEEDIKTQERQNLYYAIGGVLALLLALVAIFAFINKRRDNKIIKEQKEEVEEQKHLVESKNREITDSITYAKRIQEAILPSTRLVKEWLPNSFVLYKPKDIVAGDFYWMETQGNHVIFSAADCTGHGVPGAMVSVICHNAMNRAVREFNLTDPGKILDKVNELVEETFVKGDQEVKDGMDLALCTLEGRRLQYAGAHNPLWIIKNGEIIETKADKLPIGSFNEHVPYTTHTFDLEEGDTFYIFSDGFVDQFGGEHGKKFKAKAFRQLLLDVQGMDMQQQREKINQVFEEWRGSIEQVDDVCVIGVRV